MRGKEFGRAMIVAAGVSGGALLGPVAGAAKTPLSEVSSINQGLLAVGIADEIRNSCDDIDARLLRAVSYLHSLVSEAKALGYSSQEIEDFRNSRAEQRRLRAQGEAYLQANGANPAQPETLCALGRAEIARGSAIGSLLKAR
ncbi:DUF5333 domain-containing protein [Poseidonocella sedimentorum]|uniref:DUF5333 domain-containing protein n=1 Tax=Poseidonocella sedimentorum TaxID=871652 RepID=A0A1I6CNL6_9RHOB|nr:DUF5333 domain-containing protein [Poseidonocella sedimentorum]SFQ94746.1 hypothetical protein SAMN04515673_10190 [Poseidonocella sedimentorum]